MGCPGWSLSWGSLACKWNSWQGALPGCAPRVVPWDPVLGLWLCGHHLGSLNNYRTGKNPRFARGPANYVAGPGWLEGGRRLRTEARSQVQVPGEDPDSSLVSHSDSSSSSPTFQAPSMLLCPKASGLSSVRLWFLLRKTQRLPKMSSGSYLLPPSHSNYDSLIH